ncbi:MAG: tetratricopeptide repeat protein [Myxococcota bacterium]
MQLLVRGLLCLGLLSGSSLLIAACGEKKSAEPVVAEEPTEAVEAEKPAQKEAPPAYTIPEALSAKESRKQYARGKRNTAKKKNTAALKLRKKEDSPGAIASYKEALELSPGYVTARFNLACEYARFGNADEAIGELEHLFKMGTAEAMRKIAKLQVDSDFDPIREDPRIKTISDSFAVDFDQMLFKQICGNEGKIIGIIDHKEGLYGITTRVNNRTGTLKAKAAVVKGGKARTLVFKMLDMICDNGKVRRDERAEGPILTDTKLSKWTAKYPKRCVTYYGNIEGDPEVDGDIHGTDIEGNMCFIRQGERWTLGVAGQWTSSNDMESNVEETVKKATKKAVAAWGT